MTISATIPIIMDLPASKSNMRKRHSGVAGDAGEQVLSADRIYIRPPVPERNPAIAGAINLTCGCLESWRGRWRFDDRWCASADRGGAPPRAFGRLPPSLS